VYIAPFFEWDAEEGEQNLKALPRPYLISWFERAEEAVATADDWVRCNVSI
jgi:hypothetical protein